LAGVTSIILFFMSTGYWPIGTLFSMRYMAHLEYLEVIFTSLLGVLLFSEIYTVFSLLGIALIIYGLIFNTLYKGKTETLIFNLL